ncbi:MAG: NACHT domain-containing protein [bacterium]
MSDNNPMVEFITDAAGKAFEKAVDAISKRVRKAFKDQDAKEQIEFGIAYEDYLYNTLMKYGMVKTLINRYVPKPVESLYYPIGVDYDGQYIDTSKVTNLFRYGNKIIITGTGGIGKTIMMKYFFLNTAQETEYIPVMLELRSFNSVDKKEISIKEAIWNTLHRNGFMLDKEYFEDSLKHYRYVFLLDGFDEISSDKIETLTREILDFSDTYPNNKYILTSRPMDNLFIGFSNFCEMSACFLSKKQAIVMIQKIDFDPIIKAKFCTELGNNIYDQYKSFASIPLLLMILLLTFGRFASIPDNLNDFYEQAFSTLFSEHDATKDVYRREIHSGLGREDFKTVFSYICLKTFFDQEYEFTGDELKRYIQTAKDKFSRLSFTIDGFLYDLTTSVCMLVREGFIYRFQHRSFQDYFAAWYTCKLTDDVQQRLITKWMRRMYTESVPFYLGVLYNMQSDKVNSIIFAPVLQSIKSDYDRSGFSIAFLNTFCDAIAILQITNGGYTQNVTFGPLPHNFIYSEKALKFNVLQAAYALNGHKNFTVIEIPKRIFAKIPKQKYEPFMLLEEAVKKVGETTLLAGLRQIEEHVLSVFDILNSIEENKVCDDDTLLDLLEKI